MITPLAFDLTGELPTGTTVLEASAGTGKTYAIVGLATRYIAEGLADVSQLLLVTFSRAATQELRDRTHARIVSTAAGLADPESSDDELVRYLATGTAQEVAARRGRLQRALSDFDSATIVTTHGFCQRMLDGLGVAGDTDNDYTVVESATDLISEVVDDLYLSAYSGTDNPPIKPVLAHKLAVAVIGDRQAGLVAEFDAETPEWHRVTFAKAARKEVAKRKLRQGVRDYDDLLTLLDNALRDPEQGPVAAGRIRRQFRVVLVDEFQDTDPVQWRIFRTLFHGQLPMVLVGDPKQAIYAFRGAEVLSYLDAVAVADDHRVLDTNWRSDSGLVGALDQVYGGLALGHSQIVAHSVQAHQQKSRIDGRPALRLRYRDRNHAGPKNKSGYPAIGAQRRTVANDVARDIVRFLGSAPIFDGRVVGAGDIAVLVRTGVQAEMVRNALDRCGVPSVLAGGASVWETHAAHEWLWLLEALEQPRRPDRARLAALTSLWGLTVGDLDSGGDDAVAEVASELRDLAALFVTSGLAAVTERVSVQRSLEARLLEKTGGERILTDLRHIGQLLNAVAASDGLGLAALSRWLTARIKNPVIGDAKERSRRLDSDAAAVQIATVHRSKGLEFPIVYVPFGWDAPKNPNEDVLLFHDSSGKRMLDVGGKDAPGYAQRQSQHHNEGMGEELRLLYVALTRACSQVVVWWAPAFSTPAAPLHRMLFGRKHDDPTLPNSTKVPSDAEVAERLEAWTPEFVSVEKVDVTDQVEAHEDSDVVVEELAVARLRRTLDMEWRRTSYSALTAAAHETPGVRSEAEEDVKDDESDSEIPAVDAGEDDALPSPMNGLPAGAAFGTLVHEVLEFVDTAAADLDAELRAQCREAVAERLFDIDPDALAHALGLAMRTPCGGFTLAEVAPRDHLAELEFELPLAGGDETVAEVTLHDIAGLLSRLLPGGDSLASYPSLLRELEPTALRGYLTGSIDSVLRVDGQYVVVDYKTNRIVAGDLTVRNFDRDAMAGEMLRSHYPLQALLYCVALHRFLRWRLPDYDPAVHLGGVRYLFVRGMAGPDTPDGCGVFDWEPPAALIVELSDLLAGVTVAPDPDAGQMELFG
ncbi:UvrD-helicase domain-containing protein [Jongsikchunia kroppenstedtii]|uniref:UvrD-helicase domain-containing protein n=1 Tax=Jongsikchunia kroppenstedtii TaxID=1121721 RepID=UPI000374BDA5